LRLLFPQTPCRFPRTAAAETCLLPTCLEWNQHGNAGGQRRRGAAPAAEPCAHSGPGEGAADEDRLQDISFLQQHDLGYESGHKPAFENADRLPAAIRELAKRK